MKNKTLSMQSIANKLTDLTYTDYFYRLSLIARSVFEWENLPDGVNEEWLERYLFNDGRCVFFEDKTFGLMVAKCSDSGTLNNYDEPTRLTPFGTNYHGESLVNGKECILIKNNDLCLPTVSTIELFALRLAEISRTIDINVNAQKTPVMIACTHKQLMSMKRLFNAVTGNEPVIFGDKDLDTNLIKALKIDAPIVFPQLQIQKHEIWNECMTFLGVNNANMNKRERLVVNEVEANDEQIEMSANVMLKARLLACEKINKLYDTNINVKIRKLPVEEIEKEVVVND